MMDLEDVTNVGIEELAQYYTVVNEQSHTRSRPIDRHHSRMSVAQKNT